MTSKRGHYGSGSIDKSGESSWRIRYRIKGLRYTKVVQGTRTEAAKELRRLLHTGDTGSHVAPDKKTVAGWIEHWLSAGAPGKRKKKVGRRSGERYAELLRAHVVPAIGDEKLQDLPPTRIDELYTALEGKIAPRTAYHLHICLNACFETAVRKGLLAVNPIMRAEKLPAPGEADHGMVLDEDQLKTLVTGFKASALYPIVAVLAFTGCRRNEALALRWTDLDVVNKTLRIERALEETADGIAIKCPKTERGKRTITIDDALVGQRAFLQMHDLPRMEWRACPPIESKIRRGYPAAGMKIEFS